MKRIDASGHVGNRFSGGDPLNGQPATLIPPDWLNDVQEEIAGAIEVAGIALDGADTTQLATAIRAGGGLVASTLQQALDRATAGSVVNGDIVHVRGHTTLGDGGGFSGLVEAVPNILYPGGGPIRPLGIKVSVKMFGAVGDGVADDTVAVQATVDFVVSLGGGIVWFPAGTYVVTSVDVQEGMILQGDGGAIITRPDNQGNWWRTFTTQNRKWNSASDSPLLVFRDLTIDGNRANQGAYLGYEIEQAHMVFLYAETTLPGRLRVLVEGCVFREGAADALSIYKNVDVTVNNCWFDNVYRGGLVLTGGWSKLRASNVVMKGALHPSGVNVEIDGSGHNGSFASEIELSNFDMEGNLDIALHDAGRLLMTNINMRRGAFTINASGSWVRGSNCRFPVGRRSGLVNRIVNPHDVRLSDCTFVLVEKSELGDVEFACVDVYWGVSGSAAITGQVLELQSCDFGVGEGIDGSDTTYGIFSNADYASRNNRLVAQDCRFGKGLDHGIWQQQGGTIEAVDNYYDCGTALRLASGSTFYSDITIEGGRIGPNCDTYMIINNGAADNVIRFRDVTLDAEDNVLSSPFGLTANTYSGSRTIIGDTAPGAAPVANRGGFVGDIWQLRVPVPGSTWQWVCTASSHSAATWKALSSVAA